MSLRILDGVHTGEESEGEGLYRGVVWRGAEFLRLTVIKGATSWQLALSQ